MPAAYNTRIDDILLTALMQSMRDWTGNDSATIGMEGHGREPIVEDIDLSRTVGWFTSYFPVHLSLAACGDTADSIKRIKNQLRAIPNQGIGYGILRYLDRDPRARESLDAVLPPLVLYNYLGQVSRGIGGGQL